MLIGISADREKELRNMCKYCLMIVSDFPKRKIIKKYDVLVIHRVTLNKMPVKQILAIPVTLMVNSDGIIVWKYVGSKTDRPPNKLIFDAIRNNLE
ncbi:MAG: hypothetical protein GF364_00980 [Candidatus Lokiarchaeota archaeon]|nr:hypothetical protein [Candidatus Lokiarchaeota archaeon]